MLAIPTSELSKIPYLDLADLQGRTIPTLSFFVDGNWQLWVPTANGLVQMSGKPVEGYYFGGEAEEPIDVYLEFLDFIAQRCSWPSVIKPFQGLIQDFFNICASVKKFDLLFEQSATLKTATSRLVVTELEYLFSLCRSIFDLLQEIIAVQWQAIHLLDGTIRKKQLPKTFSNVVLNSESLRSEAELIQRFHLPQPLAAFYVRSGPFFQILRTFRDRFVHGGTTPELVFVTEKGFAVPRDREPFSSFNVWNVGHMLPNQLCSLRPPIGYIIVETLRACEDYAATIQSIIAYPLPIAPGMRFFLKGYFNESLASSTTALEKCQWWKDA